MPLIGFGSAVCVQTDRSIVYIVSQSADPNHFRGTAGIELNLVYLREQWHRKCILWTFYAFKTLIKFLDRNKDETA